MKTKRPVQSKGKLITKIISNNVLNRLAVKSGFKKRKYKKISPLTVIISYLNFISNARFSYSAWAVEMSTFINCTISKQGIYKRITPAFVIYIKLVLEKIIAAQIQSKQTKNSQYFSKFKNVYLQDATAFHLPLHLVDSFPGNTTGGIKRSVAKIQTVFNLTKRCFSFFELTNYLNPDIKSTPFVNQLLKADDLIIRDLGYFGMASFNQIIQAKAFFLSRYKHNVAIKDIQSLAPLNLAKMLKKKKFIDCHVLLSSLSPTPVRLVAIELPSEIANARIKRARKDKRSTKINHSKEYYFLLGYAIYITNVPEEIWSVNDISGAYRCRWYIENIFKSWKSHLNAHYSDPQKYANLLTIETHFYLLLIYVCVIVMPILIMLEHYLHKNKMKVQISLFKLTDYIAKELKELLNLNCTPKFIARIIFYTKYDKRSDYKNFEENLFCYDS